MSAKQQLVSWCRSQVGYHESANNYNKYAPMVTGAIGWNAQNQPWCSIFVVAAFTQCFGNERGCLMLCTTYGAASAACNANADCFKAQNRFVQTPNVGDQIFFYSGGGINHTGIVVEVTDSQVKTIEGNTSDGVYERTYQRTNSTIAGYGRPKWELVGDTVNDPEPTPTVKPTNPVVVQPTPTYSSPTMKTMMTALPLIQPKHIGQTIRAVGAMSAELKRHGYWNSAITETVSTELMEALGHFQSEHGLAPDKECGAATWAELISG